MKKLRSTFLAGICLTLIMACQSTDNLLSSVGNGLNSLLATEDPDAEKISNQKNGYGFATNKERDNLLAQINNLRSEYDKEVLKVRNAAAKTFKRRVDYNTALNNGKSCEAKKEYAYALYWYYLADELLISQGEKLEELNSKYKDDRRTLVENSKIKYRYKREGSDYFLWSSIASHKYGTPNEYKNQYESETTKLESYDKYVNEQVQSKFYELYDLIGDGLPGSADVDEFSLHDEWKSLLINAEKFGTEYGRYAFCIGKLKKGELDYSTKTATYSAIIEFEDSSFFPWIFAPIQGGYKRAWKDDWKKDMPDPYYWPVFSVAGLSKTGDFPNSVAVIRSNLQNIFTLDPRLLGWGIYNAFSYKLNDACPLKDGLFYDLTFNIIDENGKELVKPNRMVKDIQHGKSFVEFKGISSTVMDKISKGTAKLNLVSVNLVYGSAKENLDKNGKKVEISLKKIEIKYE